MSAAPAWRRIIQSSRSLPWRSRISWPSSWRSPGGTRARSSRGMTQPPEIARDEALWRALVDRERGFYAARADFMSGAADRVAVLRSALRSVAERGTALRVLPILPLAERQALFEDLVRLASVGHADVQLV